jgi:hypothetical protein
MIGVAERNLQPGPPLFVTFGPTSPVVRLLASSVIIISGRPDRVVEHDAGGTQPPRRGHEANKSGAGMIGCVRSLQDHRRIALCLLTWGTLILPFGAPGLRAQTANGLHAGAPGVASIPDIPAIDTSSGTALLPLPKTGDVLTPNTRRNTPELMLGLRAGIKRSN